MDTGLLLMQEILLTCLLAQLQAEQQEPGDILEKLWVLWTEGEGEIQCCRKDLVNWCGKVPHSESLSE